MLKHPARITCCAALMSLSITLSAGPAFAQSEATQPDSLEAEVEVLKAQNAVVRELVRKMEEQQKALLDQIERMQRRLDSVTTAVGDRANAETASAPQASVAPQEKEDRYQDGIVIYQNPETARVPFLLSR